MNFPEFKFGLIESLRAKIISEKSFLLIISKIVYFTILSNLTANIFIPKFSTELLFKTFLPPSQISVCFKLNKKTLSSHVVAAKKTFFH